MSKIGDSARHGFLTNDFAYLFVCVHVIMCGCAFLLSVGESKDINDNDLVYKHFKVIEILMFTV